MHHKSRASIDRRDQAGITKRTMVIVIVMAMATATAMKAGTAAKVLPMAYTVDVTIDQVARIEGAPLPRPRWTATGGDT